MARFVTLNLISGWSSLQTLTQEPPDILDDLVRPLAFSIRT